MVNYKIEAEAIKKSLEAARSVLLVAHQKPDADTLGSVCAWLHLLQTKGKETVAFCLDPVPASLRHLPGSHGITADVSVFEAPYDLMIVNDSGDLSYAGIEKILATRNMATTTLINVDHHSTNPRYGQINLIVPTASSTTEILCRLFTYWKEEITKPMAQNLLYGIITDTDNLTNPATSYQSLVIASELIRAGADLHSIVRQTLYTKSIADLRLWGLALSRLKRNDRYGIAVSYVTHEDVRSHGVDQQSLEGIANYLTLIPNITAALFLREQEDGFIKGSLRTVKNTVDVSKLAQLLGGGGHTKAAGFKLSGQLTMEKNNWTIL